MNKIIKGLVDDFLENYEISATSDSEDFEKFCNFSIISNECSIDANEIEDISMGKTQGIDGLAIITSNGSLISTEKEIDDLIDLNDSIDIRFIFVQAKISSNFESGDISNFFVSVKDFFNENPKLTSTPEIIKAISLKEKLWNNFSKLSHSIAKLYYVTTGQWQHDLNLQAIIDQQKSGLEALNYFDEVLFIPCDARAIQKLYKKTKEAVSCQFNFAEFTTLRPIKNVQEAYTGVVQFGEFKNIIINEGGTMKDIFNENVRDFLGENNVNVAIEKELEDANFDAFCILNNGVTIVADADKSRSFGAKISLRNYQIVNGCQTSHVLFKNRNMPGIENVFIPLKLILTNNDEVKSKITKATNSQTAIPPEQFEALTDFQKELELYYETIKPEEAKLFYERLTKQYKKVIKRSRVVKIRDQIKTFVSMFLNQPHLASGYFTKAYTENEEEMFRSGQNYYPYYISSFTMYKLQALFNDKSLDKQYRKAKYHILMLFRLLTEIDTLPPFNSRKIEKYCENIKSILESDRALEYFKKAIDIIKSITNIDIQNQKTLYIPENTVLLKNQAQLLRKK